jgi:hypothetical protein
MYKSEPVSPPRIAQFRLDRASDYWQMNLYVLALVRSDTLRLEFPAFVPAMLSRPDDRADSQASRSDLQNLSSTPM